MYTIAPNYIFKFNNLLKIPDIFSLIQEKIAHLLFNYIGIYYKPGKAKILHSSYNDNIKCIAVRE